MTLIDHEIDDDLDVEAVPHLAHVHIETRDASLAFVAHALTSELKALPAGTWVLHDPDSDGFLVAVCESDDSRSPLKLDAFLDRSLYKTVDGSLVVRERRDGKEPILWSLSARQLAYKELNVEILVGPNKSSAKLSPYMFQLHRRGFRVYWPWSDLIALCCIPGYKGQVSRLIDRKQNALNNFLKLHKCDADHHVLRSSHGLKAAADDSDPYFFLPRAGLSTFAVLVQVARWAFATEAGGGIRDSEAQAAAESLIRAIIAVIFIKGAITLHVRFVKDWAPVWPRPEPSHAKVSMGCSPSLKLDVTLWESAPHTVPACKKVVGWCCRTFEMWSQYLLVDSHDTEEHHGRHAHAYVTGAMAAFATL